MPNVNKVILIGNITREPELKHTPKGTAICEFGIAINRFIPASDGREKGEETTFVDITLFGKTAEAAAQYTKKGHPIYLEGRLSLDSWEDKQTGQKRSKLKVIGESIQFLGAKGESASRGGQASSRPAPEP